MLSAHPLLCLLFTIAGAVQGDEKYFTKMTSEEYDPESLDKVALSLNIERNITKPLSRVQQQTGLPSDILQEGVEIQKEENDKIYLNENSSAILGHSEEDVATKSLTEKNLEKRKLAMGLAILTRGVSAEQQKQPKINVGENRMGTKWRHKIPLTEDVVMKPKGLREMPGVLVRKTMMMGSEKAEDDAVMPGPGKEILETLNAWHQHRWHRLLDEYKVRGEYKDMYEYTDKYKDDYKSDYMEDYKDEYKEKYKGEYGKGTSGVPRDWEDDTMIRNWPTRTQSRENDKEEEMKVRMEMKMKEMEEKLKLQKDVIEGPDLGNVWLHNKNEEREDDMLVSVPAFGEVWIPNKGQRDERQPEKDLRRRRRIFRRQQRIQSSLKPVKDSQSNLQRPKTTSEGIRDEPMRNLPRASSSLAMRALHLLKATLQKRPKISTRFHPPRTSLLMRALTMLRTRLQRPPSAVPPMVVERFPLPPRVRQRPPTLVTLLRLGWEKLTPRLTIR